LPNIGTCEISKIRHFYFSKKEQSMTKLEDLVSKSTIAVAVLGTPELDRFSFLPLDADAVAAATKSGLLYVGALGLDRTLTPRSAFFLELPEASVQDIASAFVVLCERAMTHVEETLWLQKLHDLPDTREQRTNN
jgi:hypothetical protein